MIVHNAAEDQIAAQKENLGRLLLEGYTHLEGKVYQKSYERMLHYPTLTQLKAEELFYRFPFTQLSIVLYILALLTLLLAPMIGKKGFMIIPVVTLLTAFFLHTLILGLRIYVLQRAPVSNMFETVVYVPWIALLASFGLAYVFRTTLPLIASTTLAAVLLTVLELTQLNQSFENVQAVLDSQFWLIIHVLMIVGSYGVLCLAGFLGHYYVATYLFQGTETPSLQKSSKILLQALYLGVALPSQALF